MLLDLEVRTPAFSPKERGGATLGSTDHVTSLMALWPLLTLY